MTLIDVHPTSSMIVPKGFDKETVLKLHAMATNVRNPLKAIQMVGEWNEIFRASNHQQNVQVVIIEGLLTDLDPSYHDKTAKCQIVIFGGGPEGKTPLVPIDDRVHGDDWHPEIARLLKQIRKGIGQLVKYRFTSDQIRAHPVPTCSQARKVERALSELENGLQDLVVMVAQSSLGELTHQVHMLAEQVTPLFESIRELIDACSVLRNALAGGTSATSVIEVAIEQVVQASQAYNSLWDAQVTEAKKAIEKTEEWVKGLPRRLVLDLLYRLLNLKPFTFKEEDLWARSAVFDELWAKLEKQQDSIERALAGLHEEVFYKDIWESLHPVRMRVETFRQTLRQLWEHSLESRWQEFIHMDIKATLKAQEAYNQFVNGDELVNVIEQVTVYLDPQHYVGEFYETIHGVRKVELKHDIRSFPEHTSTQVRKIHEWNDRLYHQIGLLYRLSETNPILRNQIEAANAVIQPLQREVQRFVDGTSAFLEHVASKVFDTQPEVAETDIEDVTRSVQQYNQMFPDIVETLKGTLDLKLNDIKAPKVESVYLTDYLSIRDKIAKVLQTQQAHHVLVTADTTAIGYAQLATMDFRPCHFKATPGHVEVYLFGGSNFGDQDFIASYEEKVVNRFHITNLEELMAAPNLK